jgi:hypothetical protein
MALTVSKGVSSPLHTPRNTGGKELTTGGVKEVFLNLAPALLWSLVLLPDEYLAIEGARGED